MNFWEHWLRIRKTWRWWYLWKLLITSRKRWKLMEYYQRFIHHKLHFTLPSIGAMNFAKEHTALWLQYNQLSKWLTARRIIGRLCWRIKDLQQWLFCLWENTSSSLSLKGNRADIVAGSVIAQTMLTVTRSKIVYEVPVWSTYTLELKKLRLRSLL